MAGEHIISQSEFARWIGVSPAAISAVSKRSLKPAMVGKKVDASHPAAINYNQTQLEKRQRKLERGVNPSPGPRPDASEKQKRFSKMAVSRAQRKTTSEPDETPKKKKKRGPASLSDFAPASGLESLPKDIRELAHMTLHDLVEIFGTDLHFVDWLKATRELEVIHDKRLKNRKVEGTLVDRELVRQGVLNPVDAAHKKLLTDGARTLARRISTKALSGSSVEECEAHISEYISGFIKPLKREIARVLRDG